MAHCCAHHRQSRIIFHGCKGSVEWYCARDTVTGTSNNGCYFLPSFFVLHWFDWTSSRRAARTRDEEWPWTVCDCRIIKQIYVTSSFARLALETTFIGSCSIVEQFVLFFFLPGNTIYFRLFFFSKKFDLVESMKLVKSETSVICYRVERKVPI